MKSGQKAMNRHQRAKMTLRSEQRIPEWVYIVGEEDTSYSFSMQTTKGVVAWIGRQL
jgi:hypothetical protein